MLRMAAEGASRKKRFRAGIQCPYSGRARSLSLGLLAPSSLYEAGNAHPRLLPIHVLSALSLSLCKRRLRNFEPIVIRCFL